MSDVIYKIRVNRPCRLFIDDEEIMTLDENKLTKITLPKGEYLRKVVAIDNKAIYNETEIILSGASKLDSITLDTTGLKEAKCKALPKDEFQLGNLMYKAIEDGNGVAVAKYVDKNVMEVIIPEEIVCGHYVYEVKEIGNRAFESYIKLTSVTIPNSVNSIGYGAFMFCKNLTSVAIPNSVSCIGSSAFICSGLTSITIPNSVTNIGIKVFSGCYDLTSVSSPNSVTSIGDLAFEGCSSLTSIIIPNSVTSIHGWAFAGCSQLTSITIPNGVTYIIHHAFFNCSALTSVNLPNSVTMIGDGAFMDCKSLTSITIPSSVTHISDTAFPKHTKIIRKE